MHEFITHPRAAPAPIYEIITSLSYLFIYNSFPLLDSSKYNPDKGRNPSPE